MKNHADPKLAREHMHMRRMDFMAIFRAVFGTSASLETEEARKEALEAIGLMGEAAENLRVVVEPIDNVNDALKAIVKDLHQ